MASQGLHNHNENKTGGMMRAPFEPIGEKAKWELVYELFKGKSVGTVVTYAEISAATGVNFKVNRGGLDGAAKALEEREQRTLICVRGVGYSIAPASAHEALIKNRRRRARKQVTRAISLATNVKKSELSPEELKRLETTEITLRAQADMLSRVDKKVARQEKLLSEARIDVQTVRRDTKANVAELSERMSRLEDLAIRAGFAVEEPAQ